MDYGMPTLIELETLEDTMKLSKGLSLQFIELNMNMPQYQLETTKQTRCFQQLKEEFDIYYTVHLDENLNVCEFNPLVRNAYLETVKRTIDFGLKLEIPILNMHMNHGVHFTLPDKKVKLFEKYKEDYLSKILDFREMCIQEIGDESLEICIENTDGFLSYEIEAIQMLLESDVFGLTFDIGHSHCSGDKDELFFQNHMEKLKHFHMHDAIYNESLNKNHMTLGSGEIDLKRRFALANEKNCRCVIETKTVESLQQSIHWLELNL